MEWWMWLLLGLVVIGLLPNSKEEEKEKRQQKRKEDANKQRAYAEAVPEILAACIACRKEIDDASLELAGWMISDDEIIIDKIKAQDSLQANVLQMSGIRNKSLSLLKLKATTVINKISQIPDPLQKSRIFVMLEGLHDQMLQTTNDEKEIDMIESIIDALETNSNTPHATSPSIQSRNDQSPISQRNPSANKKKSSALKYAAAAGAGALAGSAISGTASAAEVAEVGTTDLHDEDNLTAISDGEDLGSDDIGIDEDGSSIFDIFSDD